MIELSASQIELFANCQARWGAKYLGGIEEPPNETLSLGKATHALLEAFSLEGKMPAEPEAERLLRDFPELAPLAVKMALNGLRYAPAPGRALIEHPISFSTPKSKWRGFIDVLFATGPDGKKAPPQAEEHTIVIQDWKTTSARQNVKSVEDLEENVQANLYGYWAHLALEPEHVRGHWVYLPKPGGAHPVSFSLEKQKCIDFVEGKLDPLASQVQGLYQIRPKWQELPKNLNYCYAYRKECPALAQCNPIATSRFKMPSQEKTMSEAFISDIAASFPQAGAAPAPAAPPPKPSSPPPKPPKPAPRPAPEPWQDPIVQRHAEAQGRPADQASNGEAKAEQGFVNPIGYAPEKPDASPEAVAARQGRKKPEPVVDDLSAMERPALKALAVQMGLISTSSKMGEDSLREMIRAERAKANVEADAVGQDPPFQGEQEPPPSKALGGGNAPTGAEFPAQESLGNGFAEPSPTGAETKTQAASGSDPQRSLRLEAPPELVEAAVLHSELVVGGFTLYINCRPLDGKGMDLAELVEAANEHLHSTHPDKPIDYRFIQFTGAAELVCAAQWLLDEGKINPRGEIYLDSRTPEGGILQNQLVRMASRIIRGF